MPAKTVSTTQLSTFQGTQEVEDSLKRSLIGDFELSKCSPRQFSVQEPGNVKQLGGTLLSRAEEVYKQTKTVRILASSIGENPSRFGCTVVSLLTGACLIWNGDWMTGAGAAALGATELYNQSRDKGDSSLQRFLSDINADADMIRALEEGQQQSYKVIENNLAMIHGEVDVLYRKLDAIQELSCEGIASIKEKKQDAYQKGLEAKEAYRKALELFSKSKSLFGDSKDVYATCAERFLQIKQLADEIGSSKLNMDKIDELVNVAQAASTECSSGKEILDKADGALSEAMQALAKAQRLKDEAIEMMSQTVQCAEDTLKATAEKAQYTAACKEKIDETQREMKEAKERSENVMKLLGEMSEEIKQAKAEAAKKFDLSDVVVGAGAAVVATPLGFFPALAMGATAAFARAPIVASASKIYHSFFKASSLPRLPLGKDELVRAAFHDISSGWAGWIQGRGSSTLGKVRLDLGSGEEMELDFNLNHRTYPISKEELFRLYQRMSEKLEKGTLHPKRCKAVLYKLESMLIKRELHNETVKGLIRPKQAAYGLTKAIHKFCDKLIDKSKNKR